MKRILTGFIGRYVYRISWIAGIVFGGSSLILLALCSITSDGILFIPVTYFLIKVSIALLSVHAIAHYCFHFDGEYARAPKRLPKGWFKRQINNLSKQAKLEELMVTDEQKGGYDGRN